MSVAHHTALTSEIAVLASAVTEALSFSIVILLLTFFVLCMYISIFIENSNLFQSSIRFYLNMNTFHVNFVLLK